MTINTQYIVTKHNDKGDVTMFGMRRNNNGDINTTVMLTLVGLGVGVTYGLVRGRNNNGNNNNNNMMEPVQRAMDEMRD